MGYSEIAVMRAYLFSTSRFVGAFSTVLLSTGRYRYIIETLHSAPRETVGARRNVV